MIVMPMSRPCPHCPWTFIIVTQPVLNIVVFLSNVTVYAHRPYVKIICMMQLLKGLPESIIELMEVSLMPLKYPNMHIFP